MTKIFKKTLAFFIAVIMMISSFPYMALAEESASVNEDGTTAEMTNEELKAYIDENIASASVKLPTETTLNNVPTDFYKGIVTNSSWKGPDLTQKFYSENNPTNFIKFSLNGLGNAVAVYTGENNDIRFPITANLYSNIKNKEPKFSLYIKNISLPETQSNFQFGNEWWDRCTGENKLDPFSDEQQFSSKSDGERKNPNASFHSQEKKSWRNYITYTGSGNTDSYYEKLPTKFQFKLQYECNNSNGGYTETKNLPLTHRMYVLNMKPYKDILDNLKKTDYEAVKSDESKYTEKALNNYYKAVYDVINFDIRTYLSEVTTEDHVVTAASAVKQVVENYNSAKKLGLDFTAYIAAKEKCDTIIKNQSENAEYESNSYAEFEKIYNDVTAKAETVETQEALDDLTAQLITAQTMLRKNKFSITVNIYKNSDLIDTKYYHDELYGYKFNIDLASYIDETKECVKRWVIYTNGGKTRTVVGTTDSIFTLYVTMDAVVDVYVVPLEENANPEEYSKVVFYGFNGRVIDVKYLKKGETLTSDKYTKAPDVPFYVFDSWDNASVTGNGKEIAVKAKYNAKQVENDYCTVYYEGFAGGKKIYSYDKLVSLVGAEGNEYFALATTKDGKNADGSSSILTYLNRNEFYAPKTKEIYVVPVKKEDRVAKVAITGSYATKVNEAGDIVSETKATKNRAVFNCKFYLPDEYTLVEWGAQISANGKTRAVKGEKVSKHNEYSIYMNVSKTSSVKAFTAVAYVTYKDSNNNIKTIYSQSVTQAFN